ncbi:T9SS type A sorting domain-containing protein [Hymenobacter sp. DG01]|uniref:T9SS type A sorting domain-containing protein n=1 Tax=Hymenobacter sp. DG01 TaxID=2584940 RepID=UPI001120713C|nr:T9SS type A sorting domain-containing protein [Hymenobacter sp. DG01]
MKTHLRLAVLLLAWLMLGWGQAKAEGSKNLTPGTNTDGLTTATNDRAGFLVHNSDSLSGGVDISYGFLKPASWVSPAGAPFKADYRMFIRLKPGEKLSYGVRRADPVLAGYTYKDLILTLRYGVGDGTIVQQTTLARNSTTTNTYQLRSGQAGVIDTYAQAAAGPSPAAGGYIPLIYTNNTGSTQDFFVEFTQVGEYTSQGTQGSFNDLKTPSTTFGNGTTNNKLYSVYDIWDFTVTGTDNLVKNGRLFSKFWSFSTLSAANLLSSKFTLYPLVESRSNPNTYYIKAIDLAGLRPYAFFFVTNEFGSTANATRNTIAERRKSQNGNKAYLQYPSFVNDPDPSIWPSTTVPTVSITPQPYCRSGNTEVAFTTTSSETGRFDITITYSGNTRTLTTDVIGGSSATIIWDGLVNNVRVPAGQPITYSFTNRGAAVNFPLYDAENNEGGFSVRNVRPSSAGTDVLYWDDTNIAALNTSSLNGTVSPAHAWGNNTTSTPGNAVTVNTWTYGFVSAANNLTYTTIYVCDNDGDGVTDDTDIDDDNDGILDVVESFSGTTSVDPSAFADANSPVRYLDVDYVHPIFGAFRDLNNNGVNDIFDTDGDGIPNHFDLDSDNDGLTDSFEAGLTSLIWTNDATATQSSGYSTAQGRFINSITNGTTSVGTIANSVGANGLPNAVENRGTGGTANARVGGTEVNTVRYTLPDNDQEAFTANGQTARNYNFLDLDSDNDGITDEMEALPSVTYNTRKNQANFNTDSDRDGIRDAYDGNVSGGNSITLRADTDGDSTPDMFDLDSDNDNATRTTRPIYAQTSDWSEGFDLNGSGAAGDDIVALARQFALNNPEKSAYYPVTTNGSGYGATTLSQFLQDANSNGIPNFLDITSPYYHDDNFNGLVDIYDPAYSGSASTGPGYLNATTDAFFRRNTAAAPLPVTLVSFKAQTNGQDARLLWNTSQELNNDRFVVERSLDGTTFQKVGEVKGQGTTTSAHDYSFVDAKAANQARGTMYYRLRQVDFDGSSILSDVQTVRFTSATDVTVYPNPAAATITTFLNLTALSSGTYQVKITDLAGRTVRILSQQGSTTQSIRLDNLPKGTYLLTIQGNGQTFTKRLIKE